MKYKSMFPWLILDMTLYTLLNIALINYIHPHFEILRYLSPWEFLIFGLAVYRGANVVSNEFVTTPIRAYFVHDVEHDGVLVEEPYEEGFRGFAGSLLYCPSCTGIWITGILVYSYILFPGPASIIILILALSGLERFFAYTFGRIKRG